MPKDESPEVRGLARILQSLAPWRPLIIPAMIVAFIAGAVALWWKYGDALVQSRPQQYHVALERIHLNAPPDWIKTDVRSDVFHDADWLEHPLSILEDDLTVRVAQAFEQHTWVAKVTKVTKSSPATLNLELQYRRPVAMVEVDYQGQGGLLPVDGNGILLPPEDFTAEEAITYPRITVDYVGPGGSIGTPWGDAHVKDGARIVAVLIDDWNRLGLYRVVAIAGDQPTSLAPTSYELHTRDQARVLWGHAPGKEVPQESLAEQKLGRLLRYAQQHGGFEGGDGEMVLNLVDEIELSARPQNSR